MTKSLALVQPRPRLPLVESGTVAGVTAGLVADEADPVPMAFVAVTVKV